MDNRELYFNSSDNSLDFNFEKIHQKLCDYLHETYVKKNSDYGDSFHKSIEEWGFAAAGVRISDKYNRLVNLLAGKKPNVVNESLMDTCLDLSNYCLLLYMELLYKQIEEEERTCGGYAD